MATLILLRVQDFNFDKLYLSMCVGAYLIIGILVAERILAELEEELQNLPQWISVLLRVFIVVLVVPLWLPLFMVVAFIFFTLYLILD